MNKDQLNNWKSTPSFNYHFEALIDAARVAIAEFSSRAQHIILLIYVSRTNRYLCIPWQQYRTLDTSHDAMSGTIVFRGNVRQLRELALAFPPELFPVTDKPDPLDDDAPMQNTPTEDQPS